MNSNLDNCRLIGANGRGIRQTHFSNGGKRPARAFTLIELLVVIAIIAILVGLTFAVMGPAQEKGRQATVMSNLHEISSALEAYKLDHGNTYPPVLLGYAEGGTATMQGAEPYTKGSATAIGPQGLFPQYIKSASVFQDPNNPTTSLTATTTVPTYTLSPTDNKTLVTTPIAASGGVAAQPEHTFFAADAYDLSPEINSGGSGLTPLTYVPRYSLHWTSVGAVSNANYMRQLGIPGSSDDTYVTCTTYHVANYKQVIVLWETGGAQSIDVTKFLAAQAAGTGNTVINDPGTLTAAGGVSNAGFWTVRK